jgi:hypothetical protein
VLVPERIVYVSRVTRLPLIGTDGADVGRVVDVVLGLGGRLPRVNGFAVAVGRRRLMAPRDDLGTPRGTPGPSGVVALARAHRAWLAAVLPLALLAGCGSTSLLARTSSHPTAAREPSLPGIGSTIPTPGPTGIRPAARAVEVIRAWSDALRRGNVRAAARYFALPSVMINGIDASGQALVIAIDSRAEAAAANASLPCGARFISADQRGRYVNALFRLTPRPGPGGSDCGTGAGQTARTNFVIAHGLIVAWIRAPDDPGDNGGTGGGAPAPSPEVLPPSGPTV